ncbi:unnamed protein product [Thelazia callipaeda]|uniref:Uncharacterized protein n=1 Tax=Thelazia callipaeda TaxID=103827 RepID=A0A0N5D396_THECL|nr:unnamed protein product [Thelazia callipaeda]
MKEVPRSDTNSINNGMQMGNEMPLSNEINSSNSDVVDEYDVWLVRKPVEVPLGDLSSIKFPHKPKNRVRVAFPSRSDALPLNCHFNCLTRPHVLIRTSDMKTVDDSKPLTASTFVTGVVVVSNRHDLSDNKGNSSADDSKSVLKVFSALLLNGGMMNFKIKSIRKRPKLPDDDKKQRLKPFGIIPKRKKKRYKLPNLISN